MKKSALFSIVIFLFLLAMFLTGCENPQQVALYDQNQRLADRVSELEYQLTQQQTQTPAAAQAYSATQPMGPALNNTSVYLVVKGDTLWSIARKQLGSGARYKEVLALNPHISEQKPLTIGTRLTLPPK